MRWVWGRMRNARGALIAGIFCLGSILLACSHWRIWGLNDLFLYLTVGSHSPVAREFWRGDIRAGDRIEPIIARSRPNRVWSLGPFQRVDYYPGGDLPPDSISLEATSLTARDGRLIHAVSYGCTFQKCYFDAFTREDESLYQRILEEKKSESR